jgi:hypothetical protein
MVQENHRPRRILWKLQLLAKAILTNPCQKKIEADLVMRFFKTRRLRIISGASLLLLLTAFPVFLTLTRPPPGSTSDAPAFVVAYTTGLSALGLAGMVALGLAALFVVWLLNGQSHHVGQKYVGRRRRDFDKSLRSVAIILGTAGLIVGSLAGFYAAMMHARPDLYSRMPLPFLTAELEIACLLGGALVYAAGRIGRRY